MATKTRFAIGITLLTALLAALGSGLLWWAPDLLAAETVQAAPLSAAAGWGMLAAALSTGIAAAGAGYAVAVVGSAAIGALAEKPELFGRLMVFVGLAEGIAIYGLIVAVLILNRLG